MNKDFNNPAIIASSEGNMQLSDQNLRDFCEKLEDEVNRQLFSKANSLAFITLVGETMEHHLNQLVAVRDASIQWLSRMDFPTRDDIAVLANKLIEIEDRFDRLDENLYLTLEGIKESRRQMAGLAWKLAELATEFGHEKRTEAFEENEKSIFS